MNTKADELPLDPASYPRPCHAVEGCEDVHPESSAIPARVAPMANDLFCFWSFMPITDHKFRLAATKTVDEPVTCEKIRLKRDGQHCYRVGLREQTESACDRLRDLGFADRAAIEGAQNGLMHYSCWMTSCFISGIEPIEN